MESRASPRRSSTATGKALGAPPASLPPVYRKAPKTGQASSLAGALLTCLAWELGPIEGGGSGGRRGFDGASTGR